MSFLKTIFLSFLMIGFSFSAHAKAEDSGEPDQYVYVEIIADKAQVNGGDTVRLGLRQAIYPSWHTYWKNPGDSGTATSIEWNLPPDFSVSALEWPTPNKIPYGPLTNYGYENEVVLLQNLTIPAYIREKPFILNAKVNLLVCHDICIPESHDVFIAFNMDKKPSTDQIAAAESKLPLNVDWETTFYSNDNQLIINSILEDTSALKDAKNIFIAPEDWGAIDNNATASLQLTNTGFTTTQKIGERDLSEIQELPLVISYTNAAGKAEAIRLTANLTLNSSELVVPVTENQNSSDITILSALLFALFGGIILNLMPCVFPVLSIKALSLINLGEKEEGKARGYGISYTLGILISFAAIGGTLLLLKSGGAQIGWGFQLQNPIVITALAYLVFIIGLNLAGLFEFSGNLGKLGSITQKLSDQNGHRGAFFTGVLATLVATPCTAPFMGAALGFALTQPAAISMLVFAALGFGLAIPYLLLCFVPPLRAKLPRPGAWMLTFKQFLSFPMFLTAVWLVWVLSQQAGSLGILMALSGMVFIAFGIWLFKSLPLRGIGRYLSIILIVVSFVFVGTTLVTSKTLMISESGTTQTSENNWSDFSPAKLETLLEGDAPIFTNMTAAWCITCKVNEKISLKTETITQLFAKKSIEYLKGDWTNQDSEITQYLNKFDRQGVPLYVYYGPRDNETGQRPEPVVLPQILTSGAIERVILNNQ
jgi:thiol:disulfide interchange protein DsbD